MLIVLLQGHSSQMSLMLQGESNQMSIVLIKGWSDVSVLLQGWSDVTSVVTGMVRCQQC